MLSVVVAVVGVAIALVLSLLAATVNRNNDERLLQRQADQAAAVLGQQVAVIEAQMGDVGQVADATGGSPVAFTHVASPRVSTGGPFASLTLWRVGAGQPQLLASQGIAPVLPGTPDGAAFLNSVKPTGRLTLTGIIPGNQPRLGYAVMQAGETQGLVVYAERFLPPGRRIKVPPNGPFGGLDFAVYLGRKATPSQLLESTRATPIPAPNATSTTPFGNGALTVLGASPTPLTGGLSAALPWIVLAVGVVVALSSAVTVEALSRRRRMAEQMAQENERLYHQQRGIAGTLQHALLPRVPAIEGIEVAAKYVAGAEHLAVGGDWYDVIPRPSGGCVFVVGDISGRGLPAATTMAALRFAVRAYVVQGDDIETVLAKLRPLLDIDVDHQFATVLVGEVDPSAGRIRAVSAGHFAPFVVTGGRVEVLDCPVAAPVGVEPSEPLGAGKLSVTGPATLLAFTDGLVERRDEGIDAGLDRLRQAAAATDGRPLELLLEDLVTSLTENGRRDDTVLLGLRWTS